MEVGCIRLAGEEVVGGMVMRVVGCDCGRIRCPRMEAASTPSSRRSEEVEATLWNRAVNTLHELRVLEEAPAQASLGICGGGWLQQQRSRCAETMVRAAKDAGARREARLQIR